MTINELRALLANLPPDMPVGVAYPTIDSATQCGQSIDVRETRVTDPFEKFAGKTKEIFVLEVY